MRLSIRRDFTIGFPKECHELIHLEFTVGLRGAQWVVATADHHEALHRFGPLHRYQHRHNRTITVTDQVSGLSYDGVEECDGIVRHELIRNRRLDISCMAIPSALGVKTWKWSASASKLGSNNLALTKPPCKSTSGSP